MLTGQSFDTFMQKLQKNLSETDPIAVKFVQEKKISFFDELMKSEGCILISRPSAIRFEIFAPYETVIVSSNKKVAKYEKLNGDWKKLKMKGADSFARILEQIMQWSLGDFDKDDPIFSATAYQDDLQTYIILKPQPVQLASVIKSLRIDVKKDLDGFKSITIFEPNDDYTRLIFVNEKRNAKINPEVFDVKRSTPAPVGEIFNQNEEKEKPKT